jgi:hypothetical protein
MRELERFSDVSLADATPSTSERDEWKLTFSEKSTSISCQSQNKTRESGTA